MTTMNEVPTYRLVALLEFATNDAVYGITREDRKILNVIRGVNDFAEDKNEN